MTAASDSDFDASIGAPAARPLNRTRPFYWSVRRELWENRAIWIAPMIAAGVILAGYFISQVAPQSIHFNMSQRGGPPVPHKLPPALPYEIAMIVVLMTGLVVGVFYCLGALQNERRDRSILFWKSLPVSDLTAVLAKAFIPFVVLPVASFIIVALTQLIMIVLASVVMMVHGEDAQALWAEVPLLRMWVVLAYGLVVLALWHAPLWGWLLTVSAWARRTAFLWAFGPPIALCVFERLAFNSGHLPALFGARLIGGWNQGFTIHRGEMIMTDISDIDVGKFVSSPGLWIGLAVAAVFVAATVWLRRRREPI